MGALAKGELQIRLLLSAAVAVVRKTGHIEIAQVGIVRLPHPPFSKGKFN